MTNEMDCNNCIVTDLEDEECDACHQEQVCVAGTCDPSAFNGLLDSPDSRVVTNHCTFEKELEDLINRNSMENGSDTPDFILARYMHSCLKTFNATVQRREAWYGRRAEPTYPEGI